MKNSLSQKTRNAINRDVRSLLAPTYFDAIPLEEIFNTVKAHGFVPLQEDGEEWEGFLCGGSKETVQVYFDLGNENGLIDNAALALSYFKMGSGRWEVISYIS